MRGALTASFLLLALAAADGRTLYETKCAACHGKDGEAKPPGKGSRNFNDPGFRDSVSEDAIVKITSEGKGKMPGYRSKMSPEQIRAVAAHVRSLGSSK
jgi:cytochrome c6